MKRVEYRTHRSRKGSTLLLSLIFIAMFSALAAAMATMSGANVQIAHNQQHAGRALNSAQSGLEVVRYYLSSVSVSAADDPADRLQNLAGALTTKLDGLNEVDMDISYDAGDQALSVSSVTLNSQTNESFAATVNYGADYDTLNVVVTGSTAEVNKRLGVSYQFDTVGNPIFDYGIATKGPLSMQGNVDVDGYNEEIEASVYIESSGSNFALEMTGKSSIAGTVTIANSMATVDIANSSSVYGASGADALEHVDIGLDDPPVFPVPDPTEFEQYIQDTLEPNDPTSNVTLTNIEIPANTNPSFSAHATVRGIMYIRSPNVVTFTGNAEIHGLILAEGDVDNPSDACRIDFGGTVDSYDVSTLPAEEFGALIEETGTFILAPGFDVSFRGDFDALNGVIAASGVEFQGNAGGTINGSVINYGNDWMTLDGNTDLVFNRSGVQECPAGFEPELMLSYNPTSYAEI